MTDVGQSHTFRAASRLERIAAALRGPLTRAPFRGVLKRAFESVLGVVAARGLVCRFPHGETLRVAPACRHLTWNREEYDAFRRDVRPGDVVLDIGANVGGYSMLFAEWAGPTGRVFAFEPAAAARARLEANVRLNGMAARVGIQPEAVSDAEGRAAFAAHEAAGDNRLVLGEAGSCEVPTTTIDAFCRRTAVRPALIKIDAEGAELSVLRGARQTIAAGGDGLKLYVEMHPHLWPSLGISRADVEAELRQQSLRPERIDRAGDAWTIEGVCLRLTRCGS